MRNRNEAQTLESWLDTATCGLAKESKLRVREEIESHYHSANEDAVANGVSKERAHREALVSLGDARAANKEYRKVHITAFEKRMLCEDAWIGRKVASHRYWFLVPLWVLSIGVPLIVQAPASDAFVFYLCGAGISFVLGTPMAFAINTPARGAAYRSLRWAWLLAVTWFAYGPGQGDGSWSMFLGMGVPILWIAAWADWKRMGLRGKIPRAQWPRGLHL